MIACQKMLSHTAAALPHIQLEMQMHVWYG